MITDILNKVKQYGIFHFLRRALLSFVKGMAKFEKHIVFEIPGFAGGIDFKDKVMLINEKKVQSLLDQNAIESEDATRFLNFISRGELGIGVVEDGVLAGSSWMQVDGFYEFGHGHFMKIPAGVVVMKNLFVSPKYRGRSIGKTLNRARLEFVPVGFVPVVFIVYDNKYAIRNWQDMGFVPTLSVSFFSLMGKYRKITVKQICETPYTSGLKESILLEAQL